MCILIMVGILDSPTEETLSVWVILEVMDTIAIVIVPVYRNSVCAHVSASKFQYVNTSKYASKPINKQAAMMRASA
jgi:hypothetical protein